MNLVKRERPSRPASHHANVGQWIWENVPSVRQDVAERAITVKQLRSLRTFLQYLTKTELLKQPGFKLEDHVSKQL